MQTQCAEDCLADFDIPVAKQLRIIDTIPVGETDRHRWYGVQEVVLKVQLGKEVGFIRSWFVVDVYSEDAGLVDIAMEYCFFQRVKPVEVVTIAYKEIVEER